MLNHEQLALLVYQECAELKFLTMEDHFTFISLGFMGVKVSYNFELQPLFIVRLWAADASYVSVRYAYN